MEASPSTAERVLVRLGVDVAGLGVAEDATGGDVCSRGDVSALGVTSSGRPLREKEGFKVVHVNANLCAGIGAVEGKSKCHQQVFQDSFLLKR